MNYRYLLFAAGALASPALADDPAPPATAPVAESVNLVCLGGGAANKATSAYAYGSGGWASIVGRKDIGFEDQVTLEIDGDAGRIRMPRSMLPRLHGGKGGWFDVSHVKWSENEVTGSIQVSIVNSPKLRLDRLQGMIAINGKSGDFAGRCETFNPASVQRKF